MLAYRHILRFFRHVLSPRHACRQQLNTFRRLPPSSPPVQVVYFSPRLPYAHYRRRRCRHVDEHARYATSNFARARCRRKKSNRMAARSHAMSCSVNMPSIFAIERLCDAARAPMLRWFAIISASAMLFCRRHAAVLFRRCPPLFTPIPP